MEEKFNWDLPADPDPKSDNYYNGIVSKELKDPSNVGEDLKLEKAIEPLREVYARVNPSRRSMFIAQVVYLLTK